MYLYKNSRYQDLLCNGTENTKFDLVNLAEDNLSREREVGMQGKLIKAHIYAVIVILFWGMTFVSSKVLLRDFTPIEILFNRFVIATLTLLLLAPKALKFISWKVELYSAFCGFYGVTIYFVFENNALILSNASNVSLIVSTAPLFVAIINRLTDKSAKLGKYFFLGFFIAMAGITCLSFSSLSLQLKPEGDLMALGCAIVWGLYSLYVVKLQWMGISTMVITIKSFFYAVLCAVPCMAFYGYDFKFDCLVKPINIVNYLFLAVLASSLSFLIWNKAMAYLGSVKTNVYLYATPVVTTIGAMICIDEKLTVYLLLGMFLSIAGLVISQKN